MTHPLHEDQDQEHDDAPIPRVNGCALGVLLGACLWALVFLTIWFVRTYV